MPAPDTTVCPYCDGLGEWDEGPINIGGPAPVDPIYRQVECANCEGTGRVPMFPKQLEAALRRRLDDDDVKF
jgi:RecJ-like exonuclease